MVWGAFLLYTFFGTGHTIKGSPISYSRSTLLCVVCYMKESAGAEKPRVASRSLPCTYSSIKSHRKLADVMKFKFPASSIVQVSMSSSTRCDAVSACLLSWAHTHC